MVILPVQWGRVQANEEKEACNFFYLKTDFGRAWPEYFPVFRLNQLKVIYVVSSPGLAGERGDWETVCVGSQSLFRGLTGIFTSSSQAATENNRWK